MSWLNLHKTNTFGMPLTPRPDHVTIGVYMHGSLFSGHALLNLNLPFRFIQRRFEFVFWCLERECCSFWKTDGNSFRSTNTVTMALTVKDLWNNVGVNKDVHKWYLCLQMPACINEYWLIWLVKYKEVWALCGLQTLYKKLWLEKGQD